MFTHRFITRFWGLMSDLTFRSFRSVILDEFNIYFAIYPSEVPWQENLCPCQRPFFLFLPMYSFLICAKDKCVLSRFISRMYSVWPKKVSILMQFLFGYLRQISSDWLQHLVTGHFEIHRVFQGIPIPPLTMTTKARDIRGVSWRWWGKGS